MNLSEIENQIYLSKTLEDKILLSSVYAQIVTGGKDKVYDAIKFEKKLIENIRNSFLLNLDVSGAKSENILHVLSEGYLMGGHTRLCERLAVMGNIKSDLLITRKTDQKLLDRFQSFFNHIELSFCEDVESSIRKQIEILSGYNKVVLHHHPDDIGLVISLGVLKAIDKKIKIFYVNHADHIFSFGKSLPDIMFHVSSYGIEINKKVVDSKYENTFLGIPLLIQNRPEPKNNIKRFVMAGTSYKMKPTIYGSAPKLVNYLLSKYYDYNFTVIGVNKYDYWWWWIKLRYRKRATFFPLLNFNEYLLEVNKANICVDTLPITGGTAFVEMYLSGLTPIGLSTGIGGYSPVDQVKCNLADEISLNDESINFEKLNEQIIEIHNPTSVEKRYLGAFEGRLHNIPTFMKRNNNYDSFVRSKKLVLGFSNLNNILCIRSLTFLQKMKLLTKHYRLSPFSVLFGILTTISKRFR